MCICMHVHSKGKMTQEHAGPLIFKDLFLTLCVCLYMCVSVCTYVCVCEYPWKRSSDLMELELQV